MDCSITEAFVLERTCVGCWKKVQKSYLLRYVVDSRGHLKLDVLKSIQSRGVYICPSLKCMQEAVKNSSFSLRLRHRIAKVEVLHLANHAIDQIDEEIESLINMASQDGRIKHDPSQRWREINIGIGSAMQNSNANFKRLLEILSEQAQILRADVDWSHG